MPSLAVHTAPSLTVGSVADAVARGGCCCGWVLVLSVHVRGRAVPWRKRRLAAVATAVVSAVAAIGRLGGQSGAREIRCVHLVDQVYAVDQLQLGGTVPGRCKVHRWHQAIVDHEAPTALGRPRVAAAEPRSPAGAEDCADLAIPRTLGYSRSRCPSGCAGRPRSV